MNGERSKINKLERYKKKSELDLSAQLCKKKFQEEKCVEADVTESVRVSALTRGVKPTSSTEPMLVAKNGGWNSQSIITGLFLFIMDK